MILVALLGKLALAAPIDDAEYNSYSGPSEEDVVELDSTNFDETILSSQQPWFVDFHAPWCGHCKELRPIWAELATKYQGKAKFAKLAASHNRQFDERYGIKGYPTVVYIPLGPKSETTSVKHEGGRTLSSLSDWVDQMLEESKGFLFKQITSKQVFDEYCATVSGVCLIFFFPNIKDSSDIEREMYLQTVKDVMNNHRDKPYYFLWTQAGDHPELQEKFHMNSGFPAVLLLNPLKKMSSKMTSSFTQVNLDNYLKHAIRRGRFGSYSGDIVFNDVPEWAPGASGEKSDL